MGLMSRAARGAGRFARAASDDMSMRFNPMNYANPAMPLSDAVGGGVMGGLAGAALNPDDPMQGALMGAGAGALGGAGLSLGRAGIGAMRAGLDAAGQAPVKMAQQIASGVPRPQWINAVENVAAQYGDETAREVARILGV